MPYDEMDIPEFGERRECWLNSASTYIKESLQIPEACSLCNIASFRGLDLLKEVKRLDRVVESLRATAQEAMDAESRAKKERDEWQGTAVSTLGLLNKRHEQIHKLIVAARKVTTILKNEDERDDHDLFAVVDIGDIVALDDTIKEALNPI